MAYLKHLKPSLKSSLRTRIMAAKQTLNVKNLESLGAQRLAELLIEISTGDAAAKRRLRLELAGASSSEDLAKEVRKRIVSIARSTSFVNWQKRKALVSDLETQHDAITNKIGKENPTVALELLWRFMELAPTIYSRCDDSSGIISSVFSSVCSDFGILAQAAKPDPLDLANQVYDALLTNSYGQFDNLLKSLSSYLGHNGLEHLRKKMLELKRSFLTEGPAANRNKSNVSMSSGIVYVDDYRQDRQIWNTSYILRNIADQLGDVDGYIAELNEDEKSVPKIAANIAVRLVKAGRAEEALKFLGNAKSRHDDWPDYELVDAKIAAYEALKNKIDSQAVRLHYFKRTLSASHLRDYLQNLPDFDDIEAEEEALQYAESFKGFLTSLHFLVKWPALERAARVVLLHSAKIDGDNYEILSPSAEALCDKFPLAATVLLRSMIDFSLTNARTSRYGHAARHFLQCEDLAKHIASYGAFETNEDYHARLMLKHGRKDSFWSLVRTK